MRSDAGRDKRALTVSVVVATAVSILALVWGLVAGSRVIVFDGVYTLLGVLLTAVALRVVQLVRRGPSRRFPFGRESLLAVVIGTQGLALLGTGVYAIVDAVVIIMSGGSEVPKVSAVIYAVVTLVAAAGVALLLPRLAPYSEVVAADAASWWAGAYLSAAMVVGFGGAALLPDDAAAAVAPYVDPVLVIVAVGLIMPTAVRLLRTTVKELLEMAPDADVAGPVTAAATEVLDTFGLAEPRFRLGKVGDKLYVEIDHVVPAGTWPADEVDRLRRALAERLDTFPYDVWLNVDLSADPSWGVEDAPVA